MWAVLGKRLRNILLTIHFVSHLLVICVLYLLMSSTKKRKLDITDISSSKKPRNENSGSHCISKKSVTRNHRARLVLIIAKINIF